MADQANADRKSQLILEIERSRSGIARSLRGVKQDVSVTARLKRAVARSKFVSIAAAGVAGLVVTRLLFHKKKAVIELPAETQLAGRLRETERAGFWLSVLGLLVTVLKPVMTSMLSRKLADFAARNGQASPRALTRRY